VRVPLLVLLGAVTGCAAAPPLTAGRGVTENPTTFAAQGPAQRTRNGSTQTIGLPLSRAAKIGLWTSVAVILAYLIATDGDDDPAADVP
jgi:hypothetical protein